MPSIINPFVAICYHKGVDFGQKVFVIAYFYKF